MVGKRIQLKSRNNFKAGKKNIHSKKVKRKASKDNENTAKFKNKN